MTSLIGHWPHVVFLPIWWADLLDWRCFWPPSEFTAPLVLLAGQNRAETGFVLALGRGGGAILERFFKRGGALWRGGPFPVGLFLLPRRPRGHVSLLCL